MIGKLFAKPHSFPEAVRWSPVTMVAAWALPYVLVFILGDICGLDEHAKRIAAISQNRWLVFFLACGALVGIVEKFLRERYKTKVARQVKEQTGLPAVVTLTRTGEALFKTVPADEEKNKYTAQAVGVGVVTPPAAASPAVVAVVAATNGGAS